LPSRFKMIPALKLSISVKADTNKLGPSSNYHSGLSDASCGNSES
jgi:hypothetical protein